ncbi:MAG: anti-sigma factor family protein [bacterium]
MKDCKRFEEKILEYAEGLLPIAQKKEIERHVENCFSCLNALKDLRSVRSLLRGLKPLKTSDDFETVLRTRISMERSLSRRGIINRPIRIPLYAAVGALVVIAAFFVLNSTNKYFPTMGSNEPANSVPSYLANPTLSRDSSTNSQNIPEKINYPMDWVNLSGRGISISSQETDKLSAARSDSVQDSYSAKAVNTVEF